MNDDGEIIDERENLVSVAKPTTTGNDAAQAKVDAVANLTFKAYERASTLEMTKEEKEELMADFPDEAFRTGAGGKDNLIYLEHADIRERLNSVFGPGQWAIIPRARWQEGWTTSKGQPAFTVYVECMLCVRGCFVAEAIGDMDYFPGKMQTNYGDAVEGAKSGALRRCAKELGIGLQAWRKGFSEGWFHRRGKAPPQPTPSATSTPSGPLPPCPKCGSTSSVIIGKEEYGGGYVCFTKKNGCGHKWHAAPAQAGPNAADKKVAMDMLEPAAKNGMKTLEKVWKSLEGKYRKAAEHELQRLKGIAEEADSEAAV